MLGEKRQFITSQNHESSLIEVGENGERTLKLLIAHSKMKLWLKEKTKRKKTKENDSSMKIIAQKIIYIIILWMTNAFKEIISSGLLKHV